MKRDISFELPGKTITFLDVDLPDANTPLPPTNATIHIKDRETDYGTKNRRFFAICGVEWGSDECDQHKAFEQDETHWHKHVNCSRCLAALQPSL